MCAMCGHVHMCMCVHCCVCVDVNIAHYNTKSRENRVRKTKSHLHTLTTSHPRMSHRHQNV